MFHRFALIAAIVVGAVSVTYAAQHAITQKGRTFNTRMLVVKAGDVVVFKNDDDVTHHIYSSTKGQEFNLRIMNPGREAPQTFSKPGTVDIRCGLHPGMKLTVTVQ